MAYTEVVTAETSHRAPFGRLGNAAKTWWDAYWARKIERDTVALLQSLDNRTLKDIGIDRSEIESVAHVHAPPANNERRISLAYAMDARSASRR